MIAHRKVNHQVVEKPTHYNKHMKNLMKTENVRSAFRSLRCINDAPERERQGAGVAAAVAARAGVTPRAVPLADAQAELRRQGVAL